MKLLYLCLMVSVVWASCPENESGLLDFEDIYPISSLTTSTNVFITDSRFLNTSAYIDVSTIVISASGKLVLAPGNDVSIRTKSITIQDDGQLIIGSEDCRFPNKVDIALHGSRTTDRTGLADHGEKFITVEDNGSLKLFGIDALPWTKLSSTYTVPTPEYRHKTDDSVNTFMSGAEALTMAVFDSNLNQTSYKVYDLWKNDAAKEQIQVNKMVDALDALADNDVVAISLQNYLKYSDGLDLAALYSKIEEKAGMEDGSLYLRNLDMNDAFALSFVSGGSKFSQSVDESIGKAITEARASIEVNGKKFTAVSIIEAGRKGGSNIDVIISSIDDGYPVINVVHDVDGEWKIGDSIMVASTDYSWKHAEVRKIKSFPTSNSIKLDHELEYRHYGAIEHNVDMRAEVARLTRNIRIHGELSKGCPSENGNCDQFEYDTYGCHIKLLYSFNTVHIEGVEIFHCGQTIDKGFYSIHFHMCENVTSNEAIVKRNSIHDGFRAVVVHGTYGTSETQLGVETIENVAYNILGHCYFQEDGAERANSFVGNLAASVKKVNNGFFSTDANKPTAFWITSPETVFVDNVGAGSEGFGAWYTFPRSPVGPSATLGIYEFDEASRTPLYKVDNNVFHSNNLGGLNFDNILQNADGDVAACMRYNPRSDPKDPDSDIVQVFMYRITAYKNRQINIWLRGGGFYLFQASLAESKRGVQLATGGPQHQYISHSVILGETTGNNEYIDDYPHAFGLDNNGMETFDHYLGIVFYDGPVWISDTFLAGFKSKPNNDIVAGALGFKPKNKFSSSIASTVNNLQFGGIDKDEENWVFDGHMTEDSINGFGNFDGDEVATFRDADGSVVKCPEFTEGGPYQVYKPEKFLRTNRTVYRNNWKMAWSTDLYAKMEFKVEEAPSTFDPASEMKRVNRLDASDVAYENCSGIENREYMTVTKRTEEYVYLFQYVNGIPDEMKVVGKGISSGHDVIVGVCLPDGITKDELEVKTFTPNDIFFDNDDDGIVWVDDLDALADDTTMSRLYLDDANRMLYAHFVNNLERDPVWDKFDDDHCPGTNCPSLTITLKNGASSYMYTPCFNPTAEELATDVSIEATNDCVMPKGTLDSNWGAGDTLVGRDGGLRDWTSWSECCNVPGMTPAETTRVRTCTFPTPSGDGADCSGSTSETSETETCPVECAVDGAWSIWSRWSDCSCSLGSSGVKSRTRTCDNVANGGLYCKGCSLDWGQCKNNC